jgi:hypothetical protein
MKNWKVQYNFEDIMHNANMGSINRLHICSWFPIEFLTFYVVFQLVQFLPVETVGTSELEMW